MVLTLLFNHVLVAEYPGPKNGEPFSSGRSIEPQKVIKVTYSAAKQFFFSTLNPKP